MHRYLVGKFWIENTYSSINYSSIVLANTNYLEGSIRLSRFVYAARKGLLWQFVLFSKHFEQEDNKAALQENDSIGVGGQGAFLSVKPVNYW